MTAAPSALSFSYDRTTHPVRAACSNDTSNSIIAFIISDTVPEIGANSNLILTLASARALNRLTKLLSSSVLLNFSPLLPDRQLFV